MRSLRIRAVGICLVALSVFHLNLFQDAFAQQKNPNIIIIYTDDVGYGDLSVHGGKIPTPNIDKLARQGMRFTNAHAPASTCTPSRYALLTGEYPWRRAGTGIARGDASLIIPVAKETLPKMLRRAGYRTAAVGKWHLGLGGEEGPDWNGTVNPGPKEIGFDYSFIMPATGDRVPCVYMENGRVLNLSKDDPIRVDYQKNIGNEPTAISHPELLKLKWTHGHNNSVVNGVGRRLGGPVPLLAPVEVGHDVPPQADLGHRGQLLRIVAAVLSLEFIQMFGAALIIENVFALPGYGSYAFNASLQGDIPVILGITAFGVLLVIVVNLTTDLANGWLNPKARVR